MEAVTLPNSPENLAEKLSSGRITKRRIWSMLGLRSALTFTLLLLTAGTFAFLGKAQPVLASSAFWLWFITITNLVCLFLMVRFSKLEGLRLRDLFFFNRSTWKGDLKWMLPATIGTAVFAMPPGILLARLLWTDPNIPNELLFQPIPLALIYPLFLLMPVTQALAELPVYWGYVYPRLRGTGMNRWLVIILVGFTLSIQHLFLSFQPDWRFNLWLGVKFLPFALWIGFVVDRRPTVLPYLMLLHFLMDASLPVLLYLVSTGMSLSM
jgi:hypothetical protein